MLLCGRKADHVRHTFERPRATLAAELTGELSVARYTITRGHAVPAEPEGLVILGSHDNTKMSTCNTKTGKVHISGFIISSSPYLLFLK